jgi:conjugative relaxase-like TrwC/TraI family protein
VDVLEDVTKSGASGVLTVAKVTQGSAAGYAAYLDGRSRPSGLGDYYLKGGDRVEAPGRWAGGASTVGCDPEQLVSGAELQALLTVRRPDTGAPLRRVGGNGQAVAAIDATFSAPKSISAVWAVADLRLRESIERAHEHAIDRTLLYATQVVTMIRERTAPDRVTHLCPAGLVATSWRHTTARAVDDQPPDPQLHSHVLLHGAVRHDGKLVAIDSRAWLTHRRELGAAYRTELARELAQLGFSIQRATGRGHRYFEIDGVPGKLIQQWSSRHHQVRQAIEQRLKDKRSKLERTIAAGGPRATDAHMGLERLHASGQLPPREDRYLTSATRAATHQLATRADLDHHWARTAGGAGFDRSAIDRLRKHTAPTQPASERELLDRLTEFDATFTDHEARAAALEVCAGTPIHGALAVLRRLEQSGELLALADNTRTTTLHRQLEQQTVTVARTLAATRTDGIPRPMVEREVLALDADLRERGGELTAEQRAAIELACSDRRIVIIEGQAGSGKSSVLSAVARAHQAAGQRIIVTSTAALAAQRLARELHDGDVDAAAYSTAALTRATRDGLVALSPAVTVIHDEAALASTREQQQLLSTVEAGGARLIEVGDPRQSQAVGAGGLWPHLERAAGEEDAHVQLNINVRALDPGDRRDQRLFRDGRHEDAILGYKARQRVHLHTERLRAEDAALEAAQADRQARKRTLVVAQTSNEHLDELNARAQAIRIERHELGDQRLPLPDRPYELYAGDDIQIRRTIARGATGPLRNGTTAKVTNVDPGRELITLRLAGGQEAVLDRGQIDQADLRLAYVQHPFPVQGQTTDTTHLIVSEHPTQEGSYVALTRARDGTHLYASVEQLELGDDWDPLLAVAERLGRSEPQVPSIDTPLLHETGIEHQRSRESATSEPAPQAKRWMGTLGPRPDWDSPECPAWERATAAIERYRARYQIDPEDRELLGREPPAAKFQQGRERRQTAAIMLEALDELRIDGRPRPPIEQLTRAAGALAIEVRNHTISNGWEP